MIPFLFLFACTLFLLGMTVAIQITSISTIYPLLIAAAAIGALDGSMFAAFLFHAVTTSDGEESMGALVLRERELVVNFLMIAVNMGKFWGMLTAYLYFNSTSPAYLYN